MHTYFTSVDDSLEDCSIGIAGMNLLAFIDWSSNSSIEFRKPLTIYHIELNFHLYYRRKLGAKSIRVWLIYHLNNIQRET